MSRDLESTPLQGSLDAASASSKSLLQMSLLNCAVAAPVAVALLCSAAQLSPSPLTSASERAAAAAAGLLALSILTGEGVRWFGGQKLRGSDGVTSLLSKMAWLSGAQFGSISGIRALQLVGHGYVLSTSQFNDKMIQAGLQLLMLLAAATIAGMSAEALVAKKGEGDGTSRVVFGANQLALTSAAACATLFVDGTLPIIVNLITGGVALTNGQSSFAAQLVLLWGMVVTSVVFAALIGFRLLDKLVPEPTQLMAQAVKQLARKVSMFALATSLNSLAWGYLYNYLGNSMGYGTGLVLYIVYLVASILLVSAAAKMHDPPTMKPPPEARFAWMSELMDCMVCLGWMLPAAHLCMLLGSQVYFDESYPYNWPENINAEAQVLTTCVAAAAAALTGSLHLSKLVMKGGQ